MFAPHNSPLVDGEARSITSERVYFAGSLWFLEVKRYLSPDPAADADGGDEPMPATEAVAVYLRRASIHSAHPALLRGVAGISAEEAAAARNGGSLATALAALEMPPGSQPVFEDTRERTTVAFQIRLCGSPGAPTSNSVSGRSTAGKAFGTMQESSWGWESYLSLPTLTERSTWTLGDRLRFMITIDML